MVCGCCYWKRNKTCPPPVSLWHADYLQLKSNKVQQTQGKTWTVSLNCLKNIEELLLDSLVSAEMSA